MQAAPIMRVLCPILYMFYHVDLRMQAVKVMPILHRRTATCDPTRCNYGCPWLLRLLPSDVAAASRACPS